jgi:3-deoxy-7-phosphoheptulonate synthase
MIRPPRSRVRDQHVRGERPLPSPNDLVARIPLDPGVADHVASTRVTIQRLLAGQDPRALMIVGPCSVDDPEPALEYASRLKRLAERVNDDLFLVMRVYFEKPRTTVGWKGLISDPHLDGSGDLPTGLHIARDLLATIGRMGLPVATEFLEPVIPQYLADLVGWAAIGARTTESPTHRQMASGLSMPVGFKNGTDGSLTVALDAMVAAAAPHHFLGIDPDGRVAIIETTGNPDRHLILRGARMGTNFRAAAIEEASEALSSRGLPTRILVDCSHGNSGKNPRKQPDVASALLDQIEAGDESILGWMVESYLREGRQDIDGPPEERTFGLSLTDACLGWEDTESMTIAAARRLASARKRRRSS